MYNFFDNLFITCDAPRPWGVYFQDSASPQMEALVELHDNIMFYLTIILFGVAWIMISIIRNYVYSKSPISNKYLNHGTLIELIWTITPALILILIAFPSFKLLYLMDEVTDPSLTMFVEGHQWYWSYQYPDFISDENEELEFDSYLVPKSDLEDGSFFGQCSEIWRTLHSPMPIVIESIPLHGDKVFILFSDNSTDSSGGFALSGDSSEVEGSDSGGSMMDPSGNDQPEPSDIANCTHDYVHDYPYLVGDVAHEQAAINDTMCSFAGDDPFEDHRAFPEDYTVNSFLEGDERRPQTCPRCHAVFCHDCYDPYAEPVTDSSSDTDNDN